MDDLLRQDIAGCFTEIGKSRNPGLVDKYINIVAVWLETNNFLETGRRLNINPRTVHLLIKKNRKLWIAIKFYKERNGNDLPLSTEYLKFKARYFVRNPKVTTIGQAIKRWNTVYKQLEKLRK